MANLTPIESPTLDANAVSLEICGVPIPIEKCDLKLHCKKSETTCTTSYSGGYLWDEYEPANLGGTLSWDSQWRISQVVSPPMVMPGLVLPIRVFARKAGADGPGDQGIVYAFRVIVDDSTLVLDPKGGTIAWKVSATITGPVAISV